LIKALTFGSTAGRPTVLHRDSFVQKEPEALAMPTDDRFGLDDDQ
jgi:hypothetical protein